MVGVARYFFDLHDGVSGLDREGFMCRDRQVATYEASRHFKAMVNLDPDWFATGQTWQMDVVDDSGQVTFTLSLSVGMSPNLTCLSMLLRLGRSKPTAGGASLM